MYQTYPTVSTIKLRHRDRAIRRMDGEKYASSGTEVWYFHYQGISGIFDFSHEKGYFCGRLRMILNRLKETASKLSGSSWEKIEQDLLDQMKRPRKKPGLARSVNSIQFIANAPLHCLSTTHCSFSVLKTGYLAPPFKPQYRKISCGHGTIRGGGKFWNVWSQKVIVVTKGHLQWAPSLERS